ncbi:hypothetical protein ACIP5Y_00255 [Nocardia sp. NPDC088792]|uniref:hypothetical protein n=1 Tax=Nocardia sp. NPDC088792 TaxID=3364332 RepID=UPI0037F9A880
MTEQNTTSSEQFDEPTLRGDFRRYHRMIGLQSWAIVSETELQQLTSEANAITTHWTGAPAPWKDHWDHLVTAAYQWEQDPERMQLLLDRIACDYERTGTTDPVGPIQVRNLLLAGELVEEQRSYLGFGAGPAAPDHIDLVYGYLTSYRAAGTTTQWESLPSWSTARRWLCDHAAATAPDTRVDITITGPDPLSGAAARPLMTGTDLTAGELIDHLHRLDGLLGAAAIPADPAAHSWLDDLRYDVLCDAYRDTLIDHANPWAVGRRYEHYLRADDLHTDIVDYADRAGLNHTHRGTESGEEQPDIVDARLAEIRREVRRCDIDWFTSPRASTWLDEAVEEAQQLLDSVTRSGLAVSYSDPTDTGQLTVAGFDGEQWYIQRTRTGEDGRTTIHDTPPARHRSCDELLHTTTVFAVADGTRPAPDAVTIPATVVAQLHDFERDLAALADNVTTVRELREAIRTGRPYTLSRRQPAETSQRRARTAISRDANRTTLTDTPDSEKPTPPVQPAKEPRAKRRQPPKSAGRTHRRRL